MKKISFLIASFLFILLPSLVNAATYYVSTSGNDSNSGTTTSAPFRTLNYSVSRMVGGDILYVRGGTYSETLEGNIKNNTTIQAYNGETVWMNGSGNWVIYFNNQSNITIDGINLDATNIGIDAVKFSGSSTYNTLANLEIRTSTPGELKQGILVADQSDHNTFRNIRVHGFGTTSRDHGIYVDTGYNIIENSQFYDIAGYGVHLYDGYTGTHSTNNIIRNNVFYRNNNGGIIVSSGSNNAVYNNILYNNNDGIFLAYGALNSWVHHNTSYNNRGSGALISSACDVACGSTGEFSNNILYNNGTNLSNDSSIQVLNNLIGTNPQFVNIGSNDIHLTSGSPAINAGRTLSSRVVNGNTLTFNSDFEGTSRPQGSGPDMGATEYGSVVVPPPTSVPTVSVSVNPTSVVSGNSGTLTWASTNATSCSASGSWSGAKSLNGSQSTGALTANATFTLSCTGAGGTSSQSVTVSVTMPPPTSDTIPPQVSLTAPYGGATVSGSSVSITAFATDNVAIAGVQFILDGVNFGTEDTAYPYSVSWNTTSSSNSSHTLTAVARDSSGNIMTSGGVVVVVNNVVTPPPTTNSNTIVAFKSNSSINLDGVLSESVWAQANSINFSNSARSNNSSRVSALWDDTNLYLAFDVTDSQLSAVATASNVGDIYLDDSVEMFLDIAHNRSASMDTNDFQFLSSINNVLSSGNFTSRYSVRSGGYIIEIAIPWSTFGTTVSAGRILGVLFANNDRDGSSSTQYDWLNLINTGSYSQPNLWGDLTLSGTVVGGTIVPPPVQALPLAPASLSASPNGTSQIDLTWSDSSTNETGFRIERKTGATGTYSEVSTAGANTTIYQSTGLTDTTQYYFRVRSYNTVGNSNYSPEASAVTVTPIIITPPTTTISVGDRVQTTTKVNVRSTPGGTRLGTQYRNSQGGVVEGPTLYSGYNWYRVNYDSGVDGWTRGDLLTKVTTTAMNTEEIRNQIASIYLLIMQLQEQLNRMKGN